MGDIPGGCQKTEHVMSATMHLYRATEGGYQKYAFVIESGNKILSENQVGFVAASDFRSCKGPRRFLKVRRNLNGAWHRCEIEVTADNVIVDEGRVTTVAANTSIIPANMPPHTVAHFQDLVRRGYRPVFRADGSLDPGRPPDDEMVYYRFFVSPENCPFPDCDSLFAEWTAVKDGLPKNEKTGECAGCALGAAMNNFRIRRLEPLMRRLKNSESHTA